MWATHGFLHHASPTLKATQTPKQLPPPLMAIKSQYSRREGMQLGPPIPLCQLHARAYENMLAPRESVV